MAASAVLRSDIELTQIMNISQPANPVVVQFDPDTNSYWIAPAKDRSTPILREESGEPYVVTFGSGRASAAPGVTMALANVTASALEFNSHGGLAAFTNSPTIELQLGSQAIRLNIHPTTGRISESFGVPSAIESGDETDKDTGGSESTPIIDAVEDLVSPVTNQLPKIQVPPLGLN
jgi:hypothetical protein